MSGVAFFDLDRTLLDVNTGSLWVRDEWRAGRLSTVDLLIAGWWIARYTLGDDGLEPALERAGRTYTGVPAAELAERVQTWFQARVADRVRPGALASLQAHRARGDACVLATSSSQFVGWCAAERYGLDDVVATELEVDDGVLTGRIAALGFGQHKLDQCRAWAASRGIALADATFYTDSYSDLPLLAQVGHPVVVAPDRRLEREAARRGWPTAAWGRSAA